MTERKPLMVVFDYEDRGSYRMYYRLASNKKRRFCTQGPEKDWYVCSRDGEPEDTVDLTRFQMHHMEEKKLGD